METINKRETAKKQRLALIALLVGMALCYVLLHDLFGGTLLGHCPWDSYTLQAIAWRQGRMDLGQNHTHLELAIYKGKYFVSFPPVPSLVMLPFTFFFGENTPNNLIIAIITLCIAAATFKLGTIGGFNAKDSAFLALFITFGSNLMWMSTLGGVWFVAQAMAMLLLLLGAIAAYHGKTALAYGAVALAVGCRPFSAAAFLPLLLWLYQKRRNAGSSPTKALLCQWSGFLTAALIAAAYMWYNYARFDNPLEFGHNYLPEFLQSPQGQFNLAYIFGNIKNIFRPVGLTAKLGLEYDIFDGFMFFVANPLFLLHFYKAAKNGRGKDFSWQRASLTLAMAIMLLCLCAHKTFGGWQFGARYTCDLLPLVLLYVCLCKEKTLNGFDKTAGVFGIMFNIYGALAMHFIHG